MEIQVENFSVSKIREYWTQTYLRVNHEYQRAPRWNRRQKQLLIDSLLRGYPLPLFYFHKRTQPHGDGTIDYLEVIDGQQRIHALTEFCSGKFALLDPARNQNVFPKFIWDAERPCGWASKHYMQLDFDYRQKLDAAELRIAIITTDNDDEIRDLFVRLQAGSPLKPQEKRDAFPGGMPQFIKSLGGETVHDDDQKPVVNGGHRFFTHFLKFSTPARTVKARELAAQIVMQLTRDADGLPLAATNMDALDDFYHQQVGFREDSEEARRIVALIDDVGNILERYRGDLPTPIEWVHLFVLWQRLQNGYANSWKPRMANVLRKFKTDLDQAKKDVNELKVNPLWTEFGMRRGGSGADAASKFRARQDYLDTWFHRELKPRPIDGRRVFDEDLRKSLFDAQAGTCGYFDHAFCDDSSPMPFDASEVHHILPHSQGGETEPENAVVIHKKCNRHVGSSHVAVTSQLILNAIKSVTARM